jgi:nucleoid-associated protein YgaU
MNRIGIFLTVLALGVGPRIFAGVNLPISQGLIPFILIGQELSSDAPRQIPDRIRNNSYFIESQRLTALAEEAFEEGDYDSSLTYAAEAHRYAQLSDEYVAAQVRIWETDNAIKAAKTRFDWAGSVGAADRYPEEYRSAETAYGEALDFRTAEAWDDAVDAASRVIDALAAVTAPPPAVAETPPPAPAAPPPETGEAPLPAQYTVRPWGETRDCLWNIAGRPYVYGDPTQWRRLYEANRAKLPSPDNPGLIHPGMVLDIPPRQGETREGMWAPGKKYPPLR